MNKNFGLPDKCPCNRQTLNLTAGKVLAALKNLAVKPVLFADKIESLSGLKGLNDFLVCCIRLDPFYIVTNRTADKCRFLRNNADKLAKLVNIIIANVGSVDLE